MSALPTTGDVRQLPLLFRIDAFSGLMLLSKIAFFGWIVFAMHRELRKPQPERGQPARGRVQPRAKVAPRLHQEKREATRAVLVKD